MEMYAYLGYLSVKDYKWVIHINNIKNFPVKIQDIDVAHNIWVKSVPDLKVNTTGNKPIPVAGELVQVPENLVKLQTNIQLTSDLFFVDIIPFFLAFIRKICFTAVNHIYNRKLETIFMSFKNIYSYYMKRGFHITTLYADGEFSQLQDMIYENIPGGPRLNITSVNEHVP